jgi:DNA-binding NarL/FixJ family response regulator
MEKAKVVEIILADDHPIMRKGLKDLLEEQEGWHVAGEASNGQEALDLWNRFNSALLIIDIEMPKMNGFEVIKEIQKKNKHYSVIVLTMHETESMFNRAMDLGVMGYVIKDSAVIDIIEAVKTILNGKYYISPSISTFLVRRGQYNAGRTHDPAGISKLSNTERKILAMIARSISTKDIANELFISIRTVETHRSNICQKLGLHGTNSLTHFALENKEIIF